MDTIEILNRILPNGTFELSDIPRILDLFIIRRLDTTREDSQRVAKYAAMIGERLDYVQGALDGTYLPSELILLDMRVHMSRVTYKRNSDTFTGEHN